MSILDESIPLISTKQFDQVYSSKDAKQRYKRVTEAFEQKFGFPPEFVCRSPGRVNLIGEHIDYSGYSVLPMGIERDMVMACATQPGQSIVANVNEKYPPRSFEHPVAIDASVHEWSNYFLCGHKGVIDSLGLKTVKPMQVMCDGNVPAGGGLSSSSAFVCCAAVATHHCNNGTLNKAGMTAAAIKGESYAGVQTGGMDQSISLMALNGAALLIDFYPKLNATPTIFPPVDPAPVFVIANSLKVADKHVTAPTNYNLRVVECRLAAALLLKAINGTTTRDLVTMRQVQDLVQGESEVDKLGKLLELVEKHLEQKVYSYADISQVLGLSEDEIKHIFVGSIVIQTDGFRLYQRAKHVFSEARRVLIFKQTCSNTDKDLLSKLGELMNASHESCRDLFNCSADELETLRQIALESGALGSRLTGAGWGGCTVSLVPEPLVPKFIEQVKSKYYNRYYPSLDPKQLDDVIFASKPCIGAGIWDGSFK
ncbi:ribosomal protein S5 domain 2-type protein [Gorgonomyces haynaldii]|nr:ribosomal protein S5 domain 2-type protein [Gorgonomyces haynaldii]